MHIPTPSTRNPYQGAFRKLVIAFDVGTTYSGVSYALLDPGIVPVIQGVTRFPAQQKIGGDSKIPSIIYYDSVGRVMAVGAEAMDEAFLEKVEDEGYHKVEWFKMHLRPRALAASHITDADIPPLPKKKTTLDVFADFLSYLFTSAKRYIVETTPAGASYWESVEHHIDFVLTHPNGWEGKQQGLMRQAAVRAGLVKDGIDQDRLQFVTEGEASLHFCIQKNVLSPNQIGSKGIVIVDAGGGTVDLSAYATKSSNNAAFEEVAPTECRLQGSVFVGRRARTYIEEKLRGSKFSDQEDIIHMAAIFDKTTKLSFRSASEPAYIRFGSARDKDLTVDIRNGQLRLDGDVVAGFFRPSIEAIIEAVRAQQKHSDVPLSTLLLVGGFAASDWLFNRLRESLSDLSVCRPDGHVNKAVADGAVSYYLDHFVTTRVANLTYGVECSVVFDHSSYEHVRRSQTAFYDASGVQCIPNYFDVILKKGTRVNEQTEFRRPYQVLSTDQRALTVTSVDILGYRGTSPGIKFLDQAPNSFTILSTITADTSRVPRERLSPSTSHGSHHYAQSYDVILLFGLTELKAQIAWKENGTERRCHAAIVYDNAAACY